MGTAGYIAVIVAAGKGLRMQSSKRKQYLELGGAPVLIHTLRAFDTHPETEGMVLVVPETEMDFCRKMIQEHHFETQIHYAPGGAERQDSVENGLRTAKGLCRKPENTIVMVHDGVRPFVSPDVITACLSKAEETGAAIPALKISDTVKAVDAEGKILETLDRGTLYRAQTPQAFRLDTGLAAFAHARKTGFRGTDEASILEHMGVAVNIVPGSETNIKLTTPQDLAMARWFQSNL